ncbi:MAG: hypothetical protein ACERLM_14860, partial [Acidimicrobiales bacterium]
MIATEAGWQTAADAGAVRQHLVEHAPVVETTVRVDGGQLVHRAFVAADRVAGFGKIAQLVATFASGVIVMVAYKYG